MAREAWAVLTITILAVAGCITPDPEAIEAASTQDPTANSEILQELRATAAPENVTLPVADAEGVTPADPWWIVSLQATPEGGLLGFHWTVPTGALVPWYLNDDFDADEQVVALEVSVIVPEGKEAALTTYAFLTFDDAEGNGLFPASGDGAGLTPDEEAARPFFVTLRDVEEGQVIPVIAVGVASEPMEIAIAWRVLDHDPDDDEEPIETPAAFVEERAGSPLAIGGTPGSGFTFSGYYLDCFATMFPAGPPQCFSETMGEGVTVTTTPGHAAAEAGGPWSLTLQTTPKFQHGWTLSDASYVEFGEGAVRWSGMLEVRGETQEDGGVAVAAFPLVLVGGPFLYPLVFASSISEGDGDVGTTLSIDAAGAPPLLRVVSASQVEFGSTLQELLGEPSASMVELGEFGMPIPVERDTRSLFQRALGIQSVPRA